MTHRRKIFLSNIYIVDAWVTVNWDSDSLSNTSFEQENER